MKAKELAARYKENPTQETVAHMAYDMVMEIKALHDARHSRSDASMMAVLREQNDKWKAVCRLCPGISVDAFRIVFHSMIPGLERAKF